MIARDERMVLVVSEEGDIKTIICLGHATLDGNEMHRINTLAAKNGCYAYTTAVGEDCQSFEQLYREVEEAIK